MQKCVSYISEPQKRCPRETKPDSVFCDKHSKTFAPRYWAYKKEEFSPIKNIEDASDKTLIKQVAKYQKAIDLRIQFREDAISYESRDFGHELRIRRLCIEVEKILEEIQKRVSSRDCREEVGQVPGLPGDSEALPDEAEVKLSQVLSKAFKTYQKTKKRNLQWEDAVSRFAKLAKKEFNAMVDYTMNEWQDLYEELEIKGKFTKERLDAAFLLFRIFDSCMEYVCVINYLSIDCAKHMFNTFPKSPFEQFMFKGCGRYPSGAWADATLSFILFEEIIDDYLESGESIFITTQNHMSVIRGMWYVGKNKVYHIYAGIDTNFIITDEGPEDSNTSFDQRSKELDLKFPLGLWGSGDQCKVHGNIKEYNSMQEEVMLSVLPIYVKKLQIAKRLPEEKKEGYLKKVVKEYSDISSRYPYHPDPDTLHPDYNFGRYYRLTDSKKKR